MPPKTNKDRFSHYEERKQYADLSAVVAGAGSIMMSVANDPPAGGLITELSEIVNSELIPLDMNDKVYGIDFSNSYLNVNPAAQIKKISKKLTESEKRIKEMGDIPFKETMLSNAYVYNPANGSLFDITANNYCMVGLIQSVADQAMYTKGVKVDIPEKRPGTNEIVMQKYTKQVLDRADMERKKQELGTIYQPLENYSRDLKGLIKVQFDRQKELSKTRKAPLYVSDNKFFNQYTEAIDKLVDSFTALQNAHRDYLAKNPDAVNKPTLFQYGSDGKSLLNNPLKDITAIPPEEKNRSRVNVSIANLRGQSQALKNDWHSSEIGVLGFIEESLENLDFQQKILEQYKKDNDNKFSQEKLNSVIEAKKEVQALHDKSYNKKGLDYFERQKIIKETTAFYEKHKDNSLILHHGGQSFKQVQNSLEDKLSFEGKTRKQQAEMMLADLESVNTWGRSSTKFNNIVRAAKKLVEMAVNDPNMTKEQYQAYQRQVKKVSNLSRIYLDGKNKEAQDYKKKNGSEKKWSDYTGKRIDMIKSMLIKTADHILNTSDQFTKEYNGTYEEMAYAKYSRLCKDEEEIRKEHLSTEGNHKEKFMNSFYRSLYVEKMKVKYQTDPDFSAENFYDSLKEDKVKAGAEAVKGIFNKARMGSHMASVFEDRVEAGENAPGNDPAYSPDHYKTGFGKNYDNEGMVGGVGHDWVLFELNYAQNFQKKKKYLIGQDAEDFLKDFGYKIKDGKVRKEIDYKDISVEQEKVEQFEDPKFLENVIFAKQKDLKGLDIEKYINMSDEERKAAREDLERQGQTLAHNSELTQTDHEIIREYAQYKTKYSKIEDFEIKSGYKKDNRLQNEIDDIMSVRESNFNKKADQIAKELSKISKAEEAIRNYKIKMLNREEELSQMKPGEIIGIYSPDRKKIKLYVEVLGVENGVMYFKDYKDEKLLDRPKDKNRDMKFAMGGMKISDLAKEDYSIQLEARTADQKSADPFGKNQKRALSSVIRRPVIYKERDEKIKDLEKRYKEEKNELINLLGDWGMKQVQNEVRFFKPDKPSAKLPAPKNAADKVFVEFQQKYKNELEQIQKDCEEKIAYYGKNKHLAKDLEDAKAVYSGLKKPEEIDKLAEKKSASKKKNEVKKDKKAGAKKKDADAIIIEDEPLNVINEVKEPEPVYKDNDEKELAELSGEYRASKGKNVNSRDVVEKAYDCLYNITIEEGKKTKDKECSNFAAKLQADKNDLYTTKQDVMKEILPKKITQEFEKAVINKMATGKLNYDSVKEARDEALTQTLKSPSFTTKALGELFSRNLGVDPNKLVPPKANKDKKMGL